MTILPQVDCQFTPLEELTPQQSAPVRRTTSVHSCLDGAQLEAALKGLPGVIFGPFADDDAE